MTNDDRGRATMNTRLLLISACSLVGMAGFARAGGRPGEANAIGVGLALGAPSGISAKYWLNRNHAIAGAIGGLGYRGAVLHGDYLWHRRDIVRSAPSGTTALYFGPGALLASGGYKTKTNAVLGVRGVGG